ncbi:MAG TPA: 16S rRNA (guanine(527)-N(7))-methyltransferase RsmG [Bacilli bacterium]|nr:16S rRNA (guanine(527)-N(7))-methyltransferase RsmG [Bacilli bacterium]
MMDYQFLKTKLTEKGIKITDDMITKLDLYATFLIEKNNEFNLTAITKKEEIIEKHFYDSLLCGTIYKFEKDKVIDIGTGAGFPGIPLKIVFSDINLTLLEATKKKCNFLEEVINKLDLKNVTVINKRAEEYIKEKREIYDLVLARAVAPLNVLLELCIPYIKVGGMMIVMKGKQGLNELETSQKAIEKLKIRVIFSKPSYLETDKVERYNILFRKEKSTPLKYPRLYSQIKNKPL